MKKLSALPSSFIEVSNCLHWAYTTHYSMWFVGTSKGENKVITEQDVQKTLLRLVKKRMLFSIKYGKRNIYTTKDRFNLGKGPGTGDWKDPTLLIEHGLGCSECILRLAKSDLTGEIISEQYFRKLRLGVVPDFGIRYTGKRVLLVEFSRKANVLWKRNIVDKVIKYRRNFDNYKEIFKEEPMVLFIFDIPGFELKVILDTFRKQDPAFLRGPFMFCEYEEFLKVPVGSALGAAIYTFGEDGAKYPLRP